MPCGVTFPTLASNFEIMRESRFARPPSAPINTHHAVDPGVDPTGEGVADPKGPRGA
jgi:hypothetical protein